MRKIRYWIRFLRAFAAKFKYIFLGGIAIGVLFFAVVPKITGLFLPFTRGESIGYVGRFTSGELPLSIQSEVSLGLTKLIDKNEVVPGLAGSWEALEDGRVWIFRLGDYKWQDGTRVVAKDINYSFSDVTSEIVDEKTIKFLLKDPFSPFPSVMIKPAFKKGFLGTGEWKVSKITLASGGQFVESIKLINTKTLQVKTYRFYPTEETARTAFKLGEVGQLRDIVETREIRDWKTVDLTEHSRSDMYVAVFINNQDSILSDKSLRQALAYAINKEAFGKKRAISPVSPNSWAFNPQVKQYTYNPTRSRELLQSLPKDQKQNLTIKLVTTPTLLSVADKIKTDWEAVGVKTQVQVSNSPPGDFQTMLAIQEIPPDPDQYSFWHSTQTSSNITNYRNSKESQRIDKLLEEGRTTLDQESRKQIYIDFQRFLVEDSPLIFLYHPTTYTVIKK